MHGLDEILEINGTDRIEMYTWQVRSGIIDISAVPVRWRADVEDELDRTAYEIVLEPGDPYNEGV